MNTAQNGTFNTIHSDSNANFTTYTYSAVHCVATTNVTINGTTVPCTAGHTIPIIVQENGTTLDSNFLLLGNPKPAGLDKTGIISGNTYQYIDIKTGLPIRS
jgi:hypothetical protein